MTNFGFKNVICDLKTVGNIAKEAIKERVIEEKITWVLLLLLQVCSCVEQVVSDDFSNSQKSCWKGEKAEIKPSFRFV